MKKKIDGKAIAFYVIMSGIMVMGDFIPCLSLHINSLHL